MADLHGNYKALKQCLERSNFNYDKDLLISLGDIVDGFPDTFECVEELLRIKNLIRIKGNHDDWWWTWLETTIHQSKFRHGGIHTAQSYLKKIGKPDHWHPSGDGYVCALIPSDIPETHRAFFKGQILYYIDEDNNCFVHGGFNRHFDFKGQMEHIYYWDRDLWATAMNYGTLNNSDSFGKEVNFKFRTKTKFKEIFIGHTATTNWDQFEQIHKGGIIAHVQKPITTPMHAANIWNIDTGAGGKKGKLTFMDISTKEIFQSDLSSELYPNFEPR